MITSTALHSSTQLTNLCMPMQLRHSNSVSQITCPHLMMGTFHPTYASWAWLIISTLMLVHAHTLLFRAFVELLAWKWKWLTRCQSRDLRLLLASMPAIVTVHLIGRAEALGHAHQATGPMCREVVAAAARLHHTGIMHIRIGMVERTTTGSSLQRHRQRGRSARHCQRSKLARYWDAYPVAAIPRAGQWGPSWRGHSTTAPTTDA
jgi:hypothetical protein